MPLVSGTLPFQVKGSWVWGVCVCMEQCTCPRTCAIGQSRVRHITAPRRDRLAFSSPPPAACVFPPQRAFPHSSFPSRLLLTLSVFLFPDLHIPRQLLVLLLCMKLWAILSLDTWLSHPKILQVQGAVGFGGWRPTEVGSGPSSLEAAFSIESSLAHS